MQHDQRRDALHRRIERALPRVRFLVSDELAEFAAGMVCDLHRLGEPCDADCEETVRDILALAFLYNPQASPKDSCLACELMVSDVCVFHEGYDQAVSDEVAEDFTAHSGPRHRLVRELLPGAIGNWFTKFRLAFWLDKVFALAFLVIGAVMMWAPGLQHWGLRWVLIGDVTGLACWCLAIGDIAGVRIDDLRNRRQR